MMLPSIGLESFSAPCSPARVGVWDPSTEYSSRQMVKASIREELRHLCGMIGPSTFAHILKK